MFIRGERIPVIFSIYVITDNNTAITAALGEAGLTLRMRGSHMEAITPIDQCHLVTTPLFTSLANAHHIIHLSTKQRCGTITSHLSRLTEIVVLSPGPHSTVFPPPTNPLSRKVFHSGSSVGTVRSKNRECEFKCLTTVIQSARICFLPQSLIKHARFIGVR